MEIITDLEGRVFTIQDIEGTIALVTEFLAYRQYPGGESLQRLDEQRLRYWNDFYMKLLGLKEANEKNS